MVLEISNQFFYRKVVEVKTTIQVEVKAAISVAKLALIPIVQEALIHTIRQTLILRLQKKAIMSSSINKSPIYVGERYGFEEWHSK